MKLEDILLISDMDGTLLPSGGKLSETCKAEIAAFRELGGNFTLATGRSPMGVLPYLEELKLDGFVIVNNGAGIYDIGTKEMTWCQHLPPHFRGIVADIAVKFPRVALEVLDESDRHYEITMNPIQAKYVKQRGFPANRSSVAELPEGCCKVLMAIDPMEYEETTAAILVAGYDGVEFARSGGNCFEMMAGGISKGYPLERLAGLYGKSLRNVVAVGDYYNDIEMLRKAGFSAAMETAPECVREAADRIVPSCEEDGVAELIRYVIQNHGTL